MLTGCVQRVISPEINESTIRILNRHNEDVLLKPEIQRSGSINQHLAKKHQQHQYLIKKIEK